MPPPPDLPVDVTRRSCPELSCPKFTVHQRVTFQVFHPETEEKKNKIGPVCNGKESEVRTPGNWEHDMTYLQVGAHTTKKTPTSPAQM